MDGAAPPGERALPVVVAGHVDHGKSTLVGRLLHDTGSLPEGRARLLAEESARRKLAAEWSFVLDALQIERDQGITVDTTQTWFRSGKRRYVVIDAPGHAEFLRNMLTGASQADAAILVVDVLQGLSEQTRRHALLLHLVGIRQLVVAVNKMDLAGHDPGRFAAAAASMRAYLAQLGFDAPTIVPISARHGENVVARAAALAWHRGPTLIEALDGLHVRHGPREAALRLPVQDVYRRGDRRILVGRIESGSLAVGDTVRVGPGRTARIAAFEDWGRAAPRLRAFAGESVALRLGEEAFVERGAVLAAPETAPADAMMLRIRLFWLAAEPLRAGARFGLRIATAERHAQVAAIERVVDLDSALERPSETVRSGEIAVATVRLLAPIAADRFADVPALGRGVLARDGRVVAGFVVEHAFEAGARRAAAVPAAAVPAAARERRNGHRAGIVWLTGLSGAGKSSIANAAARRLFEDGWQVQVVDGDALRAGLNADLGFAAEDRDEAVRRAAEVAVLWAGGGALVIVAMIAPLARQRARARAIAGDGFREVFVDADIGTCRRRDPKGLYKLADAGRIEAFTGVSAPYERPERPDLAIDTTGDTVERCADRLARYIGETFGAACDDGAFPVGRTPLLDMFQTNTNDDRD